MSVRSPRFRRVRRWIQTWPEVKVILGAGRRPIAGWIRTDRDVLDVRNPDDWAGLFQERRADALLAEHVWEHLEPAEGALALRHCFRYLKPGARFRIAVPDGCHPDPLYLEHVRPGGSGPSAEDHRLIYDHPSLTAALGQAGFTVELLEYWDASYRFHHNAWDPQDGFIKRSFRHDKRNRDGQPHYTSLIVDATKPQHRVLSSQ
jgi:predicted SAM-dependent methyltransferase